jgi:DNA-directed RNA polymerase specialized sigma24 family protein
LELAELSDRERQVILLLAAEYSAEEAAAELELNASTVRTFAQRGREKIRAAISGGG